MSIVFCPEIEDFVVDLLLTDWFNHGLNEDWHELYLFLAQNKILECLDHISTTKWRDHVHAMIKRCPSIHESKFELCFDLILSRLCEYKNLKDAASLLDLALWKSKIGEQSSDLTRVYNSGMILMARHDCG